MTNEIGSEGFVGSANNTNKTETQSEGRNRPPITVGELIQDLQGYSEDMPLQVDLEVSFLLEKSRGKQRLRITPNYKRIEQLNEDLQEPDTTE